jgi:hypothetical protein
MAAEPSLDRAKTLVKIALAANTLRLANDSEVRLSIVEAVQQAARLVPKQPRGKADDDEPHLPELDG